MAGVVVGSWQIKSLASSYQWEKEAGFAFEENRDRQPTGSGFLLLVGWGGGVDFVHLV